MQRFSFLLMTMLTMVFFIASCGEESENEPVDKDLCENVTCQNEGTCNEGVCECLLGFEGNNCETDVSAFITVWQTNNEGVSANNEVKISVSPDDTYSYNVDCNNDGINEFENQANSVTCTYNEAGLYIIRITGEFPRIYFEQWEASDKDKLVTVKQWGVQKWTSMASAFKGCSNLKTFTAIDTPNLSNVTDMSYMFQATKNFNQSLSSWDVSNVTDMKAMFNSAEVFNQDLSSWNVSSVTEMGEMFFQAYKFNQDISSWEVSSVTSMYDMFHHANDFNQDISSWNVSSLIYAHDMFSGAGSFNQDLSLWDVSSVKTMSSMFLGAESFNQDISSWDVSSVTKMDYMFDRYSGEYGMTFNQDLSSWAVANVTECTHFSYIDPASWTLPKPNFTNCTP